ncbi:FAD:protein FMN transferase [Patulibacter defluvii]|uniref:FAD:protein FMN transferase n=1 Tax=Patulibacter defluvii TaxID=3095358 RepID=UPI002A759C42|nr:FAD:protein FMN transferase [Patulibacter sp. DM4]
MSTATAGLRVRLAPPTAGTRPAAKARPATRVDVPFAALGTRCRVVIETAPGAGESATAALARVRRLLDEADRRLSRFRSDSDLTRLNDDPRETVPVDPLLLDAVAAALGAAERSDGLLDPTVLPALVRHGYARSRRDAVPVGLLAALRDAPERRPARPHPAARWRAIRIDRRAGTVSRPPGTAIDLGATAKGWLADRCGALLHPHARWAVDLGGDLRVGGPQARERPFAVEVAAPLRRAPAARLTLRAGAVATSGIDRRLWREPDGRPAHHLIDPAREAPAWTGLLTVTAVAASGEEAELIAGSTLLRGPAAIGRLALSGGVAIDEHGTVHRRAGGPATRLPWRWSA